MTAKNLSTIAADLIECYSNTAKNVIDACRAGGERVVTELEQRWNAVLKQSRSQLTVEVAKNASAAQLAFSVYYTKGLAHTTQGAELVVHQLVKLAEAGVERVAANASLFEEKTGLITLSTLADVTQPSAVVLSQFAAKMEEKSAALASKIAGDNITTASVKRASPFSQRRAAKTAWVSAGQSLLFQEQLARVFIGLQPNLIPENASKAPKFIMSGLFLFCCRPGRYDTPF